LSHNAQTIVALKKGRGEERIAKLIDSPGTRHVCVTAGLTLAELGEGDCVYVISNGGITDAEKS
jgi:hypothetical protein